MINDRSNSVTLSDTKWGVGSGVRVLVHSRCVEISGLEIDRGAASEYGTAKVPPPCLSLRILPNPGRCKRKKNSSNLSKRACLVFSSQGSNRLRVPQRFDVGVLARRTRLL